MGTAGRRPCQWRRTCCLRSRANRPLRWLAIITFIGWTDSRNAAPDLYTLLWSGEQPQGEVRATNLTPTFDPQRAFGPAVTLEPSGRAFAVYADGEQIHLVRYDPVGRRWSAPTQVTQGLEGWHAVARYPQVASNGAGDLVVVWEDFRNADPENDWANSKGSDIYATRCDGNAMTCAGANIKVNDDVPRVTNAARVSAGWVIRVAAIWEDQRDFGAEAPQVYVAISHDGGRTWGANTRVSVPDAVPDRHDSATRPALAYSPAGALFAAWEYHAGVATAPADIYVAQWAGAAWTTPQRVDQRAATCARTSRRPWLQVTPASSWPGRTIAPGRVTLTSMPPAAKALAGQSCR